MAVVVIEGLVALVLVLAGLRTAIMEAVPLTLKLSIGVGIGLFITLVGLREGGIVVNNPATGIGLGDLTSGPALIALGGVLVAAVLVARGVRGAVILGVFAATVLGLIFGVLDFPDKVVDAPRLEQLLDHRRQPRLSLGDALTVSLIPVIFALFMTDFFDTVGTAVAVGRGGGLLDEQGELPQTDRLLLVDSGAAAVGGAMGVSSVTTYVESGAGVAEGARTGLASRGHRGLFALAIFFVPIIALVGQGVQVGEDTFIHPAVAPALVMVGYLMIRIVADIDWHAPESAIPAFLTIAGIPLTFSIAAGIGLGVHRLRARHGRHRQGARGAPADVGDRAVLRGVLRRGLARGERVLSHAPSGTSSKRSTSTSPRSVIFSAGITDSARNESVMNGASTADALLAQQACSSSRPVDDLLDAARRRAGRRWGARARRARRRRGRRRSRRRSPAAARRRRACRRRRRRPTTRLCASWATVEANAPRRSPKPRDEPAADPAGRVVALDHGDLGEVARRVGDDAPSRDGRLDLARERDQLPGDDLDHAHARGARRGSRSVAATGARASCRARGRDRARERLGAAVARGDAAAGLEHAATARSRVEVLEQHEVGA